ncbi:MAG: glycosyltransferase [Lachnospiraceae bacterium]|nr:glycosyltransferase [Lachnospiraceae bacterium]
MKVTVATVCYNSIDTIEDTIKSVISQTYNDVEYIIVDGASDDGTIDIVDRYKDDQGIVAISEPDKGLYDAMNKATNLATGDYILFMNSGDVFYDENVIKDLSAVLAEGHDLVFGNVIRNKPQGQIIEKYHGKHKIMSLLLQGRMMCHQSVFTRIDIMRQYGFDLQYSITADYDFIMRLMRDKRELVYVDRTVSIVDSIYGISSSDKNLNAMREQDDKSLKKNFPVWYAIVTPVKKIVRIYKRHT